MAAPAKYQPSVLHIGLGKRVGARLFVANATTTDHPAGERISGNYSVVTVESVFDFLHQRSQLQQELVIPMCRWPVPPPPRPESRKENDMRLLHNSLVSMLIVTALAWSSAAHAERRIVIIHDPGPQGPSLEMSTQMVASARAAAAKEAQDAADAGQPLARPQQIKLPQMEVSAIATTVDGRREVLLRDANDPQNTASMQYPRGVGDPAVQFTVGQTVNFEPTGNDQPDRELRADGQLKGQPGPCAGIPPEATGPRDIFRYPALSRHADQEVSMFRCLRVPTTALLLSALLVPVHAGAAPQLNSSEASVIVTSFVVLSLPMAASMGLSELSKAPFKASERNARATRTKVPLPPRK